MKALTYIFLLLLLLSIGFGAYEWQKEKEDSIQLQVDRQNEFAMKDTLRVIKNALGEEIYLKGVLVADKSNLASMNASLGKELTKLEGDVQYLSNSVATIGSKSPIIIKDTIKQYENGDYNIEWKYKNKFDSINSRSLEGDSKFSIDTTGGIVRITSKGTTISKDEIRIKLTTGLTKIDSTYRIFVKTDYPGFVLDSLEGAVLNKEMFFKPKKPMIVWGPSATVGIGMTALSPIPSPALTIGFGAMVDMNQLIDRVFGKTFGKISKLFKH
jgi:hypothetical protein